MSAGPLRHHYAPVEASGIVEDYTVEVVVPHYETGEVDGSTTELVRVAVYLTREHMVQAAHEENGEPLEHLQNAEGLCGGTDTSDCLCDPGDPPRATIRLHLGMLTRSVALHEVVHASHQVYRWAYLLRATYNPWSLQNEDHAYLVQQLWEDVNGNMRWETSQHPGGPDASYRDGTGL